jgi:hypothetical protein
MGRSRQSRPSRRGTENELYEEKIGERKEVVEL